MFAYCENNPLQRTDASGYTSQEDAMNMIKSYSDYIITVGEAFGVDPGTIACCIYAEQVLNVDFLDSVFDTSLWFLDTSVGLGQVRISTARMLEDEGYIKKTESCWVGIFYYSRDYVILTKLKNPKLNILYVAAYLQYWQDQWKETMDISDNPEILATLYNLGDNANAPNNSPRPNSFGEYVGKQYGAICAELY